MAPMAIGCFSHPAPGMNCRWGGRCPYDNTPIPAIVVCGAMGTGEYVWRPITMGSVVCLFFFFRLSFWGLNLQPTERRAGIFGMNRETSPFG